jgi:hypothetical protein
MSNSGLPLEQKPNSIAGTKQNPMQNGEVKIDTVPGGNYFVHVSKSDTSLSQRYFSGQKFKAKLAHRF